MLVIARLTTATRAPHLYPRLLIIAAVVTVELAGVLVVVGVALATGARVAHRISGKPIGAAPLRPNVRPIWIVVGEIVGRLSAPVAVDEAAAA